MNFSNVIKDYLTFNRMEQRGIFVLLMILFLLVVANGVVPYVVARKPVDMAGFEKEVAAFEREISVADSLEEKARKSKYKHSGSFASNNRNDSLGNFKSYPKEIFIIELNSADTMDLQRLRGIGPAFAKRIVKYRERLGGFIDKSQLLEIWGMDSLKFSSISEHLVVNKDSVHPVNLNTVTFKELLGHPYFPYVITRAIMLYRTEHKRFTNTSELKSIRIISDSAFRKIMPYVKAE